MSERKSVNIATVEGIIDRLDRINRRLVTIVVLLIILLVGSNVAWLVYESQFESCVTETETEIDAVQLGGQTNMVSGGDINYGADSEGQEENNNKDKD